MELAWTTIHRYGPETAADVLCSLIRLGVQASGHADKYHETVTRAWVRLVADAMGPEPGEDFAAFWDANEALHDKHLPKRHYSVELLLSDAARQGWVEPDLLPLP